jgi:hypothetical protein
MASEGEEKMLLGVLLVVVGLALAAYSVPFVTGVAFAFFLLGLAGVVVGMRLIVRARRIQAN